MLTSYTKHWTIPGWSVLLVLILVFFGGRTSLSAEKPADNRVDHGKSGGLDGELISADYGLHPSDLDKFRPGRSKADVLKEVQWRGNFKAATTYKGKSVCGIMYFLMPEGQYGNELCKGGGELLIAIFIDDKFAKFVKWADCQPDELEEFYDPDFKGEGNQLRLKLIKVGDYSRFIREVESAPINVVDLKKKVKEEMDESVKESLAHPSEIDWGLTVVVYAGVGFYRVCHPFSFIDENNELKKNTALRDQFNAARLGIGMTEKDVESMLKAKPLESGKVEAGSYKIYGSNESVDICGETRFSNILVVFKEGKVTGIDRVPTDDYKHEWRLVLAKKFIDLPAPHEGVGTQAKKAVR